MTTEGPNTEVSLMYRDAHNYKSHSTVVFAGEPAPALVEVLRVNLDRSELMDDTDLGQLICEQVGLDTPTFESDDSWHDDFDHCWTEVTGIEATDRTPTDPRSFIEFVEQIAALDGWDDSDTYTGPGRGRN